MTNVFVLGLGEIGLPTALYYKDNGYNVSGWDINEEARAYALVKGIRMMSSIDRFRFDEFDAFCICVPTAVVYNVVQHLVTDYNILESPKKPLIIIESTVIPGTCRDIWNEVLKRKLGIAHIPHRYWADDPHGRGVRRKRVVAASDDDSFIRAIKFLKDVNMPTFPVYGLEVAELCKVAENAYRYVMIAYAEELYNVCKELDIDFWAVKEAIETHQTIGYILEPRKGIGGSCLPMAANIMSKMYDSNQIIAAAQEADKRYRDNLDVN